MKKVSASFERRALLWLATVVVGVLAPAMPTALADDVVFYPDGHFQRDYVERADDVRPRELVAYGSGVLFLTNTEVVFVSGTTPTALKSGLSSPKHLLVKGGHYYFTEGSTLYQGIGLAAPTAVLTHTAQIDRLLYVDAQHKELAFVSPDGIHERELFVYNFQSEIVTDQGVSAVSFEQPGFGDERRVPQRFAVGWINSVGSVLLGLRDVSSGIEVNLLRWGEAISYLLSDGTKDEVFVRGSTLRYLVKFDVSLPSKFSIEQVGDPTHDIIGHLPGYTVGGKSVIKDPQHEGYLTYRFDNGAFKLTRFTPTTYQDIADISSFQSENVLGQYDDFTLWVHKGQVFFRSNSTSRLTFGRLMPDDTVVAVNYGEETVMSKSFMNIYSRRYDDDNSVEIGDVLYSRWVSPLVGESKALLQITNRHLDECPSSAIKAQPGQCGCSVADTDTDADGVADCIDECDADSHKVEAGACGCNVPETDANKNGTADCIDVQLKLRKPSIAKAQKKVRITFPTKASISYRYTYKFLDRRYRIIRKVTGSSSSGKQLNLSIPKGAVSITLSFVAKGRGYKDYQSPNYKQTL